MVHTEKKYKDENAIKLLYDSFESNKKLKSNGVSRLSDGVGFWLMVTYPKFNMLKFGHGLLRS
jgi:hypothetical protein